MAKLISAGNKRYRMTAEEFELIREARDARVKAERGANGSVGGQATKALVQHDDGLTAQQRYRLRKKGELPPAPMNGAEQMNDDKAKALGMSMIANEFRRRERSDGVTDLIAGDLRPDSICDVTSSKTGVISDLHWPFHALYDDDGHLHGPYLTAIEHLREYGVQTLVINGDAMDCYNISTHERIEAKRNFVWELDVARAMLAHLRRYFGDKVRIIYREGNHEERWLRYIAKNADALQGLPEATLPELLKLRSHGIEWIGERSKLTVGKLWIDHGHEWFGSGGVNPARNYRMKAQDNILVGHVHKTTFDMHKRPLDGSVFAGWSMGCLCDLNPHYAPRNHWNHGVVTVDLDKTGEFTVSNRIIINGRVR